MNAADTKTKILKTAHKLFAEKGFGGVGVREISKVADVNISAVNYHFQNKENLYFETMQMSITETTDAIFAIYAKFEASPPEEFFISVFNYFIENQEEMRTSFKLYFLSSEVEVPEQFVGKKENDIGPPGGEAFFKSLQKVAPHASEEDLIWGVRTIFSQILQKSVILCAQALQQRRNGLGITEKSLRLELVRLVKIIIQELNSPQYSFAALTVVK